MTAAGWIIGIAACAGWLLLIMVTLVVLGVNSHRGQEDDWFRGDDE